LGWEQYPGGSCPSHLPPTGGPPAPPASLLSHPCWCAPPWPAPRCRRRPISPKTPNAAAWTAARRLRVGAELFDVSLNPPTVEAISLQAFPMVGYPLLPTATLAFADPAVCRWRWLRQRGGGGGGAGGNGAPEDGLGGWEDTGCSEACYTPVPADEGCMLRAECTPARAGGPGGGAAAAGEPAAAVAGPVRAAPALPAAASRQLSPPAPAGAPVFRVMSYNILADQYAGTSYAQKVLFGYCPTPLLDNNYRRQLVLEEVLAYQVG
jgi:2',5'-phosphodiesterase